MKYHGHLIIKVYEDLGETKKSQNYLYEIYKDNKFIAVALTLSSAKDFIDSNYNILYL